MFANKNKLSITNDNDFEAVYEMIDDKDVLAHFGVKGMRWGVVNEDDILRRLQT